MLTDPPRVLRRAACSRDALLLLPLLDEEEAAEAAEAERLCGECVPLATRDSFNCGLGLLAPVEAAGAAEVGAVACFAPALTVVIVVAAGFTADREEEEVTGCALPLAASVVVVTVVRVAVMDLAEVTAFPSTGIRFSRF